MCTIYSQYDILYIILDKYKKIIHYKYYKNNNSIKYKYNIKL